MAETFVGISSALGYEDKAVRENPCLAVNLAMLGVGTVEECHQALVEAGISQPKSGQSDLPEEETAVTINGRQVLFGATQMWFDVESALTDTGAQFAKQEASIFVVKLNEAEHDEAAMHLILLPGHFEEDGEVNEVIIGDSLLDGMQSAAPLKVVERLQKTLDWAGGAIFSCHVSVSRVLE